MQYKVSLEADINSSLSEKELRTRIVLALYDIENGYSKLDGIDNDLDVIDYNNIYIEKIKNL